MKKILEVYMHPSSLYYAMFMSLAAFSEELEDFKRTNGCYPDEIRIPEFTYRGIPIKTGKIRTK